MIEWLYLWVPVILGILVFALVALYIIEEVRRSGRLRWARQASQEREARPPGHFVFAKLMDSILPMQRAAKYEEPLDEALFSRGFGLVTGGGTQMAEDGSVAWVALDLDLSNLDDALEFTRQRLRELGAPPGSVLEYRVGERKISDPIVTESN